METHGVEAARINAPMTAQDYKLFVPVGRFTRSFLTALPIVALGLAYAATQLAAYFKVPSPLLFPTCAPGMAACKNRAPGIPTRSHPSPCARAACLV